MKLFQDKFSNQIIQNLHEGIISLDLNENITFINKIAQNLIGKTDIEALGENYLKILNIKEVKSKKHFLKMMTSVSATKSDNLENINFTIISEGNIEKEISCRIKPLIDSVNEENKFAGISLLLLDISEKRKFEKEFQKALRLNSLGKLSRGIAHDFNNVLTAILGNISLAKIDAQEGEELHELLSEAEEGIDKARKMTEQLLTFSPSPEKSKEKSMINVDNLLREFISFTLSGSNVTCEYDIPDNLWDIKINKGDIKQAIHNIVINAVQSMPIGGVINVSTSNAYLENKNEFNLDKGHYIKIMIKDQGIGFASNELRYIFDPLYTSDMLGKGMGLSIVKSIIDEHEGYITLQSELDVGTTVIIYLPAVKPILKEKETTIKKAKHFGGKILIMDDEDVIRRVLGKMLKQLGYKPYAVRNVAEAIKITSELKEKGQLFDAAILDLTIRGGLGGKETIKKLLEIDPDLKAIASSGYTTDEIMKHYKKYGFTGVLVKPYKVKELDEVLNELFKI